jgi:adenosylmethionine-8-amino-7-oxononanoate aminotransferase
VVVELGHFALILAFGLALAQAFLPLVGVVRGIRDSIVMCPPLIISHAEIDRMIDIIARSLREAEPALRALESS